MSEIKIPEITLPTIDLPDTPYFIKNKLEGKIPGCNLYHRDLETTRNPSLLISDKRGTYTVCPEGQIPSYNPMRYDPSEIIYVEETPLSTPTPSQKDTNIPQPKPKEKEEIKLEPCPGKNDLRIGSFVNEKKLERIKDYIREENGECRTIYEKVDFKDQYIPEFSTVVSTTLIASVAATTPLILNAIKPLVKNIIKKLTKKKEPKSKV